MDMEGHVISQLAGELVEQFEANQARQKMWGGELGGWDAQGAMAWK